jgi:NhaP-type Na+/H+ or K+/H+ antiporter
MHQSIIVGFSIIVILGITAQWLAWRFKLPAILLLLIFGFLAGPVTGFIHVDELFGELLFPFVSVSVAIILFEGGLSLKLEEIRGEQGVVRLLVSLGALVTWAVISTSAYFILGLDLELAVLLGAVLVVTGPTVIIPILRQIRPTTRLSSILKWEGILIDPIGATLAVLVFESIIDGGAQHQITILSIASGIVITLLVGTLIGGAFAYVLVQFLKRNWIAPFLETAVALMVVLTAYAISNELRTESGLMAVTVMGIILTNQKQANISHITSFKEELGVLLLSALFIVLAARVNLAALIQVVWQEVAFLLVIILIARPLSVLVSTMFSKVPRNEKLFLSAMAPRGIVAVAVASLFAIELDEAGFAGAEQLVNITFTVVVGTVIVYSIMARPLAHWLDVTQKQPQGTLIVGAHRWARQIAAAIQEAGYDVWLVDTNSRHIENAEDAGLRGFHESIMADGILDDLPMECTGRLLALTDNDELNTLASLRYGQWLGEGHVYQLVPAQHKTDPAITEKLRGHTLFATDMTYRELEKLSFSSREILLVQENAAEMLATYRENGIFTMVLFVIDNNGRLLVSTADNQLTPRGDQAAIVWVDKTASQEALAKYLESSPLPAASS